MNVVLGYVLLCLKKFESRKIIENGGLKMSVRDKEKNGKRIESA